MTLIMPKTAIKIDKKQLITKPPRTRGPYLKRVDELAYDLHSTLLRLGFTVLQIDSIWQGAGLTHLDAIYKHCKQTPNLLTYGFSPEQITKMGSHSSAFTTVQTAFDHFDKLLALGCTHEQITQMGSTSSGSKNMIAFCSDMTVQLLNLGFKLHDIYKVTARAGGSLKLELAHQYAAAFLSINKDAHDRFIKLMLKYVGVDLLEMELREILGFPPTGCERIKEVVSPKSSGSTETEPGEDHVAQKNNMQANTQASVVVQVPIAHVIQPTCTQALAVFAAPLPSTVAQQEAPTQENSPMNDDDPFRAEADPFAGCGLN